MLFLLFASIAGAQTKPGPQQPPADPAPTSEVHAKIRDLQLEQAKLNIRALQLNAEMSQIQGQFSGLTTQINALSAEACGNADWTLDQNTLKCSKVEKKPEEKKPAEKAPKKP